MTRHPLPRSANSSTVALETVLRAEGAAEERVRRAHRDADAILAAARVRAETIKRRADLRISRVHVAHMGAVDAEIARRRAAAADPADAGTDADETRALARVIERLAAELTGEVDDAAS